MRITVVGCGHVGLVTGSCLAAIGHHVVCTDNDDLKIQTLISGKLPFYEPHLEAIVSSGRKAGNLAFTSDAGEAIRAGEVIFICVGTPPLDTGDADLTSIDGVARMIAAEARSSKLVVEKSTVPVQTGQQLKRNLAEYGRNAEIHFSVASNPEFLREGTAVQDFFHPDRIVVGVDEPAAEHQLREIYRPLLERNFQCPLHAPECPPAPTPPFIDTSINSAELIKHASNSFLALKISYANALADLCERLGADVEEVTRAVGLDPRIGPDFLHAGLGFGGFCLPKDVQAFIRLAERAGLDLLLLKEAEQINRERVERFVDKVRTALGELKDKKIGILGLAFKPHTDDIRFSPALKLMGKLLAEGAQVSAYDPAAMEITRAIYPSVRYGADPYDVSRDADALLICTEWPEFAALDWAGMHGDMARPLLLDGRNMLDPSAMKTLGFEYHCFGRPQ